MTDPTDPDDDLKGLPVAASDLDDEAIDELPGEPTDYHGPLGDATPAVFGEAKPVVTLPTDEGDQKKA